jgi:hypothetical protein
VAPDNRPSVMSPVSQSVALRDFPQRAKVLSNPGWIVRERAVVRPAEIDRALMGNWRNSPNNSRLVRRSPGPEAGALGPSKIVAGRSMSLWSVRRR